MAWDDFLRGGLEGYNEAADAGRKREAARQARAAELLNVGVKMRSPGVVRQAAADLLGDAGAGLATDYEAQLAQERARESLPVAAKSLTAAIRSNPAAAAAGIPAFQKMHTEAFPGVGLPAAPSVPMDLAPTKAGVEPKGWHAPMAAPVTEAPNYRDPGYLKGLYAAIGVEPPAPMVKEVREGETLATLDPFTGEVIGKVSVPYSLKPGEILSASNQMAMAKMRDETDRATANATNELARARMQQDERLADLNRKSQAAIAAGTQGAALFGHAISAARAIPVPDMPRRVTRQDVAEAMKAAYGPDWNATMNVGGDAAEQMQAAYSSMTNSLMSRYRDQLGAYQGAVQQRDEAIKAAERMIFQPTPPSPVSGASQSSAGAAPGGAGPVGYDQARRSARFYSAAYPETRQGAPSSWWGASAPAIRKQADAALSQVEAASGGIVTRGNGQRTAAVQGVLKSRTSGSSVASPGGSMHQRGTAYDLRSQGVDMMDGTPGNKWMRTYGALYGFMQDPRMDKVWRNPETGKLQNEPWHWEFSPRLYKANAPYRQNFERQRGAAGAATAPGQSATPARFSRGALGKAELDAIDKMLERRLIGFDAEENPR